MYEWLRIKISGERHKRAIGANRAAYPGRARNNKPIGLSTATKWGKQKDSLQESKHSRNVHLTRPVLLLFIGWCSNNAAKRPSFITELRFGD